MRRVFAVALILGLSAPRAVACGFEDPSSAALQRGILNLAYPQSLHVIGALSQARLDGVIAPAPTEANDPFALFRTTRMLQAFGKMLGETAHPDDELAFSLVLIEPMLWTRFSFHGGRVLTSVHVNGPTGGDPVVIATETAIRAIVGHRLTAERADQMGLIRFYGDPEKIARLRANYPRKAIPPAD